MIAGSSEQLVQHVQRERTRTSVRWHHPERHAELRRDLSS